MAHAQINGGRRIFFLTSIFYLLYSICIVFFEIRSAVGMEIDRSAFQEVL